MSVSNQTNKVSITGNGVTTAFSFSFPVFSASQLIVYKISSTGTVTTLTYITDYSVSINTSTEGGTVTLTTALPSGYTGLIKRVVPYTQSVSLPNEGPLPATQIENQLDLMSMAIIQIKEITDRAIILDPTSTLSGVTLPTPEDGKVLAWSGTDGTLINVSVDSGSAAASAAAAAASAVAAAASQTAAEASQTAAAASAVAAAASASSISVPSPTGNSLKILRQKVGENGLEYIAFSSYDQIIALVSKILKTAKGANVASASTMTLGDDGNLFNITGTTTINNITAKTAGTFASLYFSSAVTLSVSGNLKLAGNASFSAAANDAILMFCDGTNWREVGRATSNTSTAAFVPTNIQAFTANGTWTKPAGVSRVYVKLWGAGGGSGLRSAGTPGGSGGGAGGYCEGPCTVTGDVTVTVGTGGGHSTDGGLSSFAGSTTLTANGGVGGADNGGTAGAGGTASNGSINLTGEAGDAGGVTSTISGGRGGSSPLGGAGGSQVLVAGAGGEKGSFPGGGASGGGGTTTSTAGSGANGLVLVYY